MATIHRAADADLEALAGQRIAVVGYGNQGRAQALNLRDSGCDVTIGNIRDAAHEAACRDGFRVLPIAEAAAAADGVLLLIPDEVMPVVYEQQVAPGLRRGDLLGFASGYNVAFGLIEPPPDVDVVLVAPRMIGAGVRDGYLAGRGFPSFVGVHRDATGRARARMLALARGIGSTPAGCIEMSLHDEASLDLFTEQGFGPAFGRVLISAVEVLVEAGYPPEAVLLELYLSGELAYSLEKGREMGMVRQMDLHSHTSQYGTLTRGARFLEHGEPLKGTMRQILDEIRSGCFAEEWSRQQPRAAELFTALRKARDAQPIAKWEEQTRRSLRLGTAGGD